MSGIPAGAGQLLGKRLGKFEIVALLALGGTAEIYLARIGGAAGFEKYVVVKCLHDHLADDAEFVKMFLDEARLAAHLDHSNIVQTMELGEHAGRYYMVMEFLAGLSLAMIIRRATERLPGGRVPVPLVLNILAQSCAGLHYAHEKAMNGRALHIVHRDISPQNLVISFEGVVKLVDFGIAKAEMRETRTRSGTIKGKFAYMSPEQCVANNVDRRTDVFALGVIGHELLTGRRLFKRPSPYETYQAVMECDVRPPSTVNPAIEPALDAVLMRAIAKDKASRYPTAEAFGDALLGYLHHRGIGSGPGDVSRFFDAQFAQEIDEHSARMRELIAGRDLLVDISITWGDAGEESRRNAGPPGELGAAEPGAAAQRLTGPRSFVLDDLGAGSRDAADDEMPAERTRIESNPLERVNELERLATGRASSHGDGPTLLAPSIAVPVPPPGEVAPAGRRAPLASASEQAANPFSEAANLPTLVAVEPLGTPPAAAAPARPSSSPRAATLGGPPLGGAAAGPAGSPLAVPSLGGSRAGVARSGPPRATPPLAVPSLGGPSLATRGAPGAGAPGAHDGALGRSSAPSLSPPASALPTSLPSSVPGGGHALPRMATGSAPPLSTAPSHGTSSGAFRPAPGGAAQGTSPTVLDLRSGPPPAGASAPEQPPNHAAMYPQGYPVLNAEMSAQIATGATVFPSESARGTAPPLGPPLRGDEPSGAFDGPRSLGGEPASAPGAPGPDGGGIHPPQRAAGMMSPVGEHFAENVDWAAAATNRVRAVPPWMLAVLFLGAIGVALTLTIVIARLAR